MSEKQRIVLASGNAHKIKEIAQMLPEYEVVGYKELGFDEEIVSILKRETVFSAAYCKRRQKGVHKNETI